MKMVYLALTGDTDGFKFPRLGACYKARWMGKAIEALGLFLLEKKTFTEVEEEVVEESTWHSIGLWEA